MAVKEAPMADYWKNFFFLQPTLTASIDMTRTNNIKLVVRFFLSSYDDRKE